MISVNLTINPRKLIYWQIMVSMLVKLIAQVIPALALLEHTVDIINIILLFFIIIGLMKQEMRGVLQICNYYDIYYASFRHCKSISNQNRCYLVFLGHPKSI